MNVFDRICAVGGFVLGLVLVLLGVLGLFTGCSANFRLPPVLGVLPAFVGWGILRAIVVSWNVSPVTNHSSSNEVVCSVRTLRQIPDSDDET